MTARTPIQKEVLKLYRQFLKASRVKPPETREVIRQEFRENAGVSRKETIKIDYLLRRGKRQLKILENSADRITRTSANK